MVIARPVAALLFLAAASCHGATPRFTVVPPPSSWQEDLRAGRATKDATFAEDADSPIPESARASFRGLVYFAPDPSWRYAGFLERYAKPERFTVVTTAGQERPCERWGRLRFERDGRGMSLQVYRLLDQPEREGGEGLFLPFKDGTTGKETYAAGRYVDLEGAGSGPYTLDFNRAYAPSCAYGDVHRFQCPITPAENTLPVRVEAGERSR